jgi:ferredoxin-NADP reductase/nitrite reductase/ring-hydroxylating ferredoxin subunit
MTAAKGFRRVGLKNGDLKEGGLAKVDVDGRPIVLAKVSGRVYALDAVCSHEGGPLEEGTLQGYELKCPWHYAIFDVRNAKVSDQTVWATDLQSYPVEVDAATGDILVGLRARPSDGGGGNGQEATSAAQQQQEPQQGQEGSGAPSSFESSQKKYYEEEESKAGSNKLVLELLSKEKLEGTDIMTFRLSRGGLDYAAGQYAFFKLEGVGGDPKGDIRHFSIASSPTEQDYLLISTRIRDGPYKQRLASLESGAKITAWGPEGEFTLHEDHSRPAIFLSGGIGVTPFRSMIKYATDRRLAVKITMFDSNKNKEGILYREEFDEWARQNKNLKIVYTVTGEGEAQGQESSAPGGWAGGERGRIDRQMLEKHLTKEELDSALFYVCGPPGMLKAMQEMLKKEMQVQKDRIKVEAFTGY